MNGNRPGRRRYRQLEPNNSDFSSSEIQSLMIDQPQLFFKGIPSAPYRDPDEDVLNINELPGNVREHLRQRVNLSQKVSPNIYLTLKASILPGREPDHVKVTADPLSLPEVWTHQEDFHAHGYDSGHEDELAAARPDVDWARNRGDFYATREFSRRKERRIARRHRRAHENQAWRRYYMKSNMMDEPFYTEADRRGAYEYPFSEYRALN